MHNHNLKKISYLKILKKFYLLVFHVQGDFIGGRPINSASFWTVHTHEIKVWSYNHFLWYKQHIFPPKNNVCWAFSPFRNAWMNFCFALVYWLVGCTFESNCPLVGPGTIGEVPSVGVFLRDPNRYLRKIRRKQRKTQSG